MNFYRQNGLFTFQSSAHSSANVSEVERNSRSDFGAKETENLGEECARASSSGPKKRDSNDIFRKFKKTLKVQH